MPEPTVFEFEDRGLDRMNGRLRDARGRFVAMGKEGDKAGKRIDRSFSRGLGTMRRYGGQLAAVAGVAGFGAVIKTSLDFGKALAKLQVEAGLSNKEIISMKNEMRAIGEQFGLTQDEMLTAYQTVQDFGGELRKVRPAFGDIAKFARATLTPVNDVSLIAAQMVKTLKMDPGEVASGLDLLHQQARAANVSISEMAAIIPELAGTMQKMGFGGKDAIRVASGAAQVVGSMIPNAQQARTAVKALFRELTSKEKAKKFEKLGVGIFTDKTKTKMRELPDIMADVFGKTKGNIQKMSELFSDEAKNAVLAFQGSFTREGRLISGSDVEKMFTAQGAAENIEKNFQTVRKSAAGGAALAADQVKASLSNTLTGAADSVTAFIARDPATAALLGLGGVVGGIALKKGAGALMRGLGKRAGGGALGAALSGVGVQKVFVTNMGGLGGMGGGVPGVTPLAPLGGMGAGAKTGRLMMRGGKALLAFAKHPLVLSAAAGYALGTYMDQKFKWSDRISDSLVKKEGEQKAKRVLWAQSQMALQRSAARWGKLVRTAEARGGGTFTTKAGEKKAITQANAVKAMQGLAAVMGVTGKAFEKMLPQLLAIMKDPTKVTIKTQNLEKPKVTTSRAPRPLLGGFGGGIK